jgi:hypothetical protein
MPLDTRHRQEDLVKRLERHASRKAINASENTARKSYHELLLEGYQILSALLILHSPKGGPSESSREAGINSFQIKTNLKRRHL